MSIVRWAILRNKEDFNSEVPSDEEEEGCSRPPPTAAKSDDSSEDPQSSNLVSEKSTLSNVAKREDNSPADQNESRDSLPQLVFPAVASKDGKTPRRGKVYCAKYLCHY